ncbi:MAG: hypothetical protein MAG453_00843 [Calditrichaeota bacterium]|nr:hypothetical protein [Calditrichota bacterium]
MKPGVISAILLATAITCSPAAAYFWEVGGSTGIRSCSDEVWDCDSRGRYDRVDFRPHVSMFLTERTTLGASFGFDTGSASGYSTIEWVIGPRLEHYFKENGPGYPTANVQVTYGLRHYSFKHGPTFADGIVTASGGVGYLVLVTDMLGVSVNGSFSHHWYDHYNHGWVTGTTWGLTLGIRFVVI